MTVSGIGRAYNDTVRVEEKYGRERKIHKCSILTDVARGEGTSGLFLSAVSFVSDHEELEKGAKVHYSGIMVKKDNTFYLNNALVSVIK